MNQLVSLNNQAVECLLKGDAFEACNILMTMTSLYMQLSDQVVQTPSGSRRYHQHSDVKIQWVPFSSSTTTKEEEDYSLSCTKMNVDNSSCSDDHQHQYKHHHHDDSSLSSSSPSVILPYNHALLIRKACCCGSGGIPLRQRQQRGTIANDAVFCPEILVPEDKICMHCWDDYAVCPCTITPVMWYNLAITCQTLAFQQQQQQQQKGSQPSSSSLLLLDETMFYFKRSLYLYEQALDIIGHGPTVVSNGNTTHEDNVDYTNNEQGGFLNYYMNSALPRHRFIKTLRLAIWNNRTCIYHTLGQEELSKMGMQTLQLQLQRQQPFHYWGGIRTTTGAGGSFLGLAQQQQQEGTRIFYENIANFFQLSSQGSPCVAGAA